MQVKLAIMGMKYWKEILIAFAALFMFFFVFFLSDTQQQDSGLIGGTAEVSENVLRYRPTIEKYAAEYGVSGYVELLLAKMMQESGGLGGDPMQSSESLGLPPNTLNDPEYSIKVGVRYFSEVLAQADNDVLVGLQSYNFGGGFIPYAQKYGGYSLEVAKNFSNMMANRLGWDSYGDVNYVPNVLRYLKDATVVIGEPNDQGFVRPINTKVTSAYGYRSDPFTGKRKLHGGVDYSCNRSNPPIVAAKDAVVIRAGWQNPYNHQQGFGQRVYLDHGNGVVTVYGHLSVIGVSVGDKVFQGQVIGKCGTTGSSTAEHLHLELHIYGNKKDPKTVGLY